MGENSFLSISELVALSTNGKLTEIDVAKYSGFDEDELKWIELFWNLFDGSKILLDDTFIQVHLTTDDGKDWRRHFLCNILEKYYIEGDDYEYVTFEHELVQKAYSLGNASRSSQAKNLKYPLVGEDCMRKLLMRSKAPSGDKMCNLFMKFEKLARKFFQYIAAYTNSIIEKQKEAETRLIESHAQLLERERKKHYDKYRVASSGYIYAATTKSYARTNIYKIGKSKMPYERLKAYNGSGRSIDEEHIFYYVYHEQVPFVDSAEDTIKDLLKIYKETQRREMVKIDGKVLIDILNMVVKINRTLGIGIDDIILPSLALPEHAVSVLDPIPPKMMSSTVRIGIIKDVIGWYVLDADDGIPIIIYSTTDKLKFKLRAALGIKSVAHLDEYTEDINEALELLRIETGKDISIVNQ